MTGPAATRRRAAPAAVRDVRRPGAPLRTRITCIMHVPEQPDRCTHLHVSFVVAGSDVPRKQPTAFEPGLLAHHSVHFSRSPLQ
jgi:hypothetical protein